MSGVNLIKTQCDKPAMVAPQSAGHITLINRKAIWTATLNYLN